LAPVRESWLGRGWPSLALAVVALAAFVAGGIVGFMVGFCAVLLLVDRLWPVTGMLNSDARQASARLSRQRRLASLRRRMKRRPAEESRLLLLPDSVEAGAEHRRLGVLAIPLDSIVGSTEPDKAQAFDRCFRPPEWSRGRWQTLWIAHQRGTALPPIDVYRVGDRHYVRDGHHRVSVARATGADTIDAEVVELRPRRAP
jgi:hypothetical protein